MTERRTLHRWIVVALAAAALSACGGGGGVKRAPVAVAVPSPRPAPRPAEPAPRAAPDLERPESEKPSPFSGGVRPETREPAAEIPESSKRAIVPASAEGFESRAYRADNGKTLPYRLFRPKPYDPAKRYPVVLVLHGSSGRGDDNAKQMAASNGPLFWASPQVQSRYPAFVVVPQADPRLAPTWVRAWRRPAQPDASRPEPLELAIELLTALAGEFSIDKNRRYVVGYSMGGFGAWLAVSRHPRLFAAAVPIAGGGDPSQIGGTAAQVWAFHGATDKTVPVRRSREMVAAMRVADKPVRYTEIPGVGHGIWRQAWSNPKLAEWLFGQQRADDGDADR